MTAAAILAEPYDRRSFTRLIDNAVCVQEDAPPNIMLGVKLKDHIVARLYCARCPVQAECLSLVRPQASRFDGTAGGRYWVNGEDQTSTVDQGGLKHLTRYKHSEVSHVRIKKALLGQLPVDDLSPSDRMVYAYALVEHNFSFRMICRSLGFSQNVLQAIITIVEHDAPLDTVTRARWWPVS